MATPSECGTASQPGVPAEGATTSAKWTVSRYAMLSAGRGKAMINVDHPNHMGVKDETGLAEEQQRLTRFRGSYVDRTLHDVSMGRTRGLAAALFRRSASASFLAKCREKTCFRREDLSVPTPHSQPPIHIEDGARHAVDRARQACSAAAELYGEQIVDSIELGFSRPFHIQELKESDSNLPKVKDALANDGDVKQDPDSILSLVISYRHTTAKEGNILNIPQEEWLSISVVACSVAEKVGCTHVRFWTDQILSTRKPRATLRWVSSGVLPYAIYPVLFVQQRATNLSEDLGRMWISVEHLMATFGQGIIHAGGSLESNELPPEWPSTFIRVDSCVTWEIGLGHQLHASVRKLCGTIMCGLVRNKAMSWASDAQEMLDWASTITSALLFRDIAHSFDCTDCREPIGYTGGHRFMTLLSSGTVIDPRSPDVLFNQTHPRLDVPAVELLYLGRSWDGFREWVPESCLWGTEEDDSSSLRKQGNDKTRVLVTSMGGPRALAILQFCLETAAVNTLIVAHMLVGLLDVKRGGRTARVGWSKRFWPMEPLQMWKLFQGLWEEQGGEATLKEFAALVGASSNIDYTDIENATSITKFQLNQVRWN